MRTNRERHFTYPCFADFGKPAWQIVRSADTRIVPISDSMTVPQYPKDTTRFGWQVIRCAQQVHALQALRFDVGVQDIRDRAYFSEIRPNRYALFQAFEHRDPYLRVVAYDLMLSLGDERNMEHLGSRLLKQPSARPERLALVQLFVQTMLGPHNSIKEAHALLRRRMRHLHPDKSDAAIAAVKLRHADYCLSPRFSPEKGRDELLNLLMQVKNILETDVYTRCLYTTDWEAYGETRRRDMIAPVAAMVLAFALGFAARHMASVSGCLAGARVAGYAISALCALMLLVSKNY